MTDDAISSKKETAASLEDGYSLYRENRSGEMSDFVAISIEQQSRQRNKWRKHEPNLSYYKDCDTLRWGIYVQFNLIN